MIGTNASGVKRATRTKEGKSVSTKQPSTPTAHSVEQQSSTSGVDVNENYETTQEADVQQIESAIEATARLETNADGLRYDSRIWAEGNERISDAQIREWLTLGATDLYQSAIEKVRGELHWKFKHLSTKKVMYDLYPEWRIPSPKHFWEGVLCSCPEGYVRGAACEHKATLRVWLGIHRSVEGVKHLLDLPF